MSIARPERATEHELQGVLTTPFYSVNPYLVSTCYTLMNKPDGPLAWSSTIPGDAAGPCRHGGRKGRPEPRGDPGETVPSVAGTVERTPFEASHPDLAFGVRHCHLWGEGKGRAPSCLQGQYGGCHLSLPSPSWAEQLPHPHPPPPAGAPDTRAQRLLISKSEAVSGCVPTLSTEIYNLLEGIIHCRLLLKSRKDPPQNCFLSSSGIIFCRESAQFSNCTICAGEGGGSAWLLVCSLQFSLKFHIPTCRASAGRPSHSDPTAARPTPPMGWTPPTPLPGLPFLCRALTPQPLCQETPPPPASPDLGSVVSLLTSAAYRIFWKPSWA